MGVLDFIFGNRDDDLESTEPLPKENHLENIWAMDLPLHSGRVERDSAVVPALVPRTPVLAEEIVLRQLVAELLLHAPTPGEDGAPQG